MKKGREKMEAGINEEHGSRGKVGRYMKLEQVC